MWGWQKGEKVKSAETHPVHLEKSEIMPRIALHCLFLLVVIIAIPPVNATEATRADQSR